MGIGGLDTEFAAIFRRAFASRIFPPGLVEKLGIQHVKGPSLFFCVLISRYPPLRSTRDGKDFDGAANRKDAQRERAKGRQWSRNLEQVRRTE